ncbi:MAG: hypothetical protein ACFFDN_00230 [Candidatus Hodarchaeota archaeon]
MDNKSKEKEEYYYQLSIKKIQCPYCLTMNPCLIETNLLNGKEEVKSTINCKFCGANLNDIKKENIFNK